jgi:hypothetical protein
VVSTEAAVSRRGRQAGELSAGHVDEGSVISAFEIDVRLMVNAGIDNHVEAVTLADGGYGASRAVLE